MALTARDHLAGVDLGHRFSAVRPLRVGTRFAILIAHDTGSRREVVVKVPHESSGSWLHDVLVAEGQILAAIGGHPHVITCFEQRRLDDGRPALLLERCRGTLCERLRAHPLPLPEVVSIGIQLAGALETAHRYGVLHCDVRPRTVLVSEWGEPVLAGFDEAVRFPAAATRAPLHHLTPHTAPELLEGGEPSTASDVYGLAATLYELVAGRAAFREYAGESPASVIVRVLSNPVLPIVAPDVPIEVSDVLRWALAPNPVDRPPSPAWLAEELGRIERRQGWPRTRMVAS